MCPELLQVKDDGMSVKEWILRYAEKNVEESSEEEDARNGDESHSPETDKKFDPVSQNPFRFPPEIFHQTERPDTAMLRAALMLLMKT